MKAFEFFSAKRQQFAQRAQAAFAQYKEAKKQRGMTLLEVIIVLGIIGTIAAGVVVLAQRAFDSRTVSEVVQNTNTIRVAMKDAFSSSGSYPADYGNILTLNSSTITSSTATGPITSLVKLGKIGVEEARNKISGDFYAVGGGLTAAEQRNPKGFVVEVNGLTSAQCRSILSQVGNNWDYVATSVNAGPGVYSIATAGVSLIDAAQDKTDGVLKSLTNANNISPDLIVKVCNDPGANNSIILGSR
ncbi:type IV pilus major pilin [Vibrio cholerae]|uniref:type IV pilus major pilin n=1 Tax=Vibrio cholerae TaxID=666 RepID=UPI0011F18D2A|nr:type IV pilus major pilin [Vibrio cholerae]KAA1003003.1 type IV pilus major pilin [Vibrio cholerae]KAA1008645.1 type IV pilus major pilin [Vibrio cholerae]KAA1017271.1 type IV pilus major pilin [Vibrio cholerae]KAA1023765.1 type IV pilus major pilin [Vibrio cholerae]KAA1027533.1 type IV pilus major pilin [Vibrio cholerae]